MDANDIALIIAIVGIGIAVASILDGGRRTAPLGLGPTSSTRYDDAGWRRARAMDIESPQRSTMDEVDAREARKRERFAHLALIAPTPELIREVMALEDGAPPSRTAVIPVGQVPVPADR